MKKLLCFFGLLVFVSTASAASETTQYRCVLKEQNLSFEIRQFSTDDKVYGYKLVVKDTTDANDPYSEIFMTARVNSNYDDATRELVWSSIGLRITLNLKSPNSERYDAVNGEVYVDGNAAIPDISTRDNYITLANVPAVCFLEGRKPK